MGRGLGSDYGSITSVRKALSELNKNAKFRNFPKTSKKKIIVKSV